MVEGFPVACERLLEKDLRSFIHILSCRHGNRHGCDFDQWPKSVTRSRPHCFGTKLGRECTKSPWSWPRATLQCMSQIQACYLAFAGILGDGSVITWGSVYDGGDSSSVQDQLKNVQQIQASYASFAANLGDGSVVTWGAAEYGPGLQHPKRRQSGDSSSVKHRLKNV